MSIRGYISQNFYSLNKDYTVISKVKTLSTQEDSSLQTLRRASVIEFNSKYMYKVQVCTQLVNNSIDEYITARYRII